MDFLGAALGISIYLPTLTNGACFSHVTVHDLGYMNKTKIDLQINLYFGTGII